MAPIEIELDGQQIGTSAETYSVIEWPELDLRIVYYGDNFGRMATVFYKEHVLTEFVVKDAPTSIGVNPHKISPIEKGEPPTIVYNHLTLTRTLESPNSTE